MDKNVFIQNLKDTTTVLQQLEVCIEQLKEGIDEINDVGGKYDKINTNIWSHNISLQVSSTVSGLIYLNIVSNKSTLDIADIHTYLSGIQSCTGYISDTNYLTVIGISKNGYDYKVHCVNEYGYTYINVSNAELDILSDNARKVVIIND